jgi:hypothetical protein
VDEVKHAERVVGVHVYEDSIAPNSGADVEVPSVLNNPA